MACGGLSAPKELDEDTKNVVRTIRPQVENHLKRQFDKFEPVQVRQQVVAGINHFIKVKVSPSEFVHLRVYKDLKQGLHLHGVLHGKAENDALDYFDQNVN